MTHANAPLTPEGRRRLAVLVVEQGWPTSAMPLTQQIMRGSAPRRPDRTIRATRATPA